jgi:hypothetical protein
MIPSARSGHFYARLLALCALLALSFGTILGATNAWFSPPHDSRVVCDSQNWVTIFQDSFEDEFPEHWEVGDGRFGCGEYHWGKRDCRAYEGFHSAWAVGGGENGALLSCGSDYPNNAYSYMTYGPFSLQDAVAAELTFALWLNSQPDVDSLFWGFSTNGQYYRGPAPRTGRLEGWTQVTLDLGEAVGEPEVWITFLFLSDASVRLAEGAYFDNVMLRKQLGAVEKPTPTETVRPTQYMAYLPLVVKPSQ